MLNIYTQDNTKTSAMAAISKVTCFQSCNNQATNANKDDSNAHDGNPTTTDLHLDKVYSDWMIEYIVRNMADPIPIKNNDL